MLLTVVVAGGGYLAIWQQKFTSDGVNVMCQAVTTNPQTAKEVQQLEIVYTTRAVQFIKDIQVLMHPPKFLFEKSAELPPRLSMEAICLTLLESVSLRHMEAATTLTTGMAASK